MIKILDKPGHYQSGADTNHFLGRCAECDAHYMAAMNLDRMEGWYHTGHFSQVKYEAYMHVWATSAYHYGSNGAGWHDAPTDPDVIAFCDLLKKAMRAKGGGR